MKNLHQQVLELLPQCIEDRRWLHRHAELSFREYKTADYLEQALCELEGLEPVSYTHLLLDSLPLRLRFSREEEFQWLRLSRQGLVPQMRRG